VLMLHVFTDVVFNNEEIYDGILVLPGGVRGVNNLIICRFVGLIKYS
jgi:hypothetical protein